MTILPGDIALSRAETFVGRGIRWFEGPAAWSNHAMIGVKGGGLASMEPWRGRLRNPADFAELRVYRVHELAWPDGRRLTLDLAWRAALGTAAAAYIGDRYGLGKIVLHALGLRRLCFLDGFPICSWATAMPFARVCGWWAWPLFLDPACPAEGTRQVAAGQVQPGDLEAWCEQPGESRVERVQ